MPPSPAELAAIDLGRLAYAPALQIQRETHARVLAGEFPGPGALLLVEHDPVITVSQRPESAGHILAGKARLAKLGIDVQPTDRGGDITYHGPGQLVAYPILRLTPLGLNVGRYMRVLESAIIDTLAAFGVEGFTEKGATGVWVANEKKTPSPQPSPGGRGGRIENPLPPGEGRVRASESAATISAKIAAIGVRVQRGVTLHGLALNVTTDLSHFDTIVPCGLHGRAVTSLCAVLGERAPTMARVKEALVSALRARLARGPAT